MKKIALILGAVIIIAVLSIGFVAFKGKSSPNNTTAGNGELNITYKGNTPVVDQINTGDVKLDALTADNTVDEGDDSYELSDEEIIPSP